MNDELDANSVKVGMYSNTFSAGSDSALLTSIKIPNTVQYYGTVQVLEYYIWAPRQFKADAKEALNAKISEADLTVEALSESPPDDAAGLDRFLGEEPPL